MILRPPRATRTATPFPYTPLFRSSSFCPYKVRRFNWAGYADDAAESRKAQRNPNVTVRARGVMEKCTYCIQRSEEHTSELQSLMRISYAVFCLKKKSLHHFDGHDTLILEISQITLDKEKNAH